MQKTIPLYTVSYISSISSCSLSLSTVPINNESIFRVSPLKGDIIVVAVQNVLASSDIKKGAVSKALIVRTKKEIRRPDGSYIRFDDNACVLLNGDNELRGSRIFGPVARELRAVNMKVVSLAPEVL